MMNTPISIATQYFLEENRVSFFLCRCLVSFSLQHGYLFHQEQSTEVKAVLFTTINYAFLGKFGTLCGSYVIYKGRTSDIRCLIS
jgi:hypothetical protein